MASPKRTTSKKANEAEDTPGVIWRFLNLIAAALMVFRSYTLIMTDPDWWIWVPMYSIGSLLSGSTAIRPQSSVVWRYLCALMVVAGSMYVMYTMWVVKEVATAAYLWHGGELMEGREMAYMAIAVSWATMCRLHVHKIDTIANFVRFLIFAAILSCCLLVAVFSTCFFHGAGEQITYCQALFRPDMVLSGW